MNNKLCLGTVQFGLPYGISNSHGKIPTSEISSILNYAYNNEIMFLDTAISYGDSESILGEHINDNYEKFQIIAKYPENCTVSPKISIENDLEILRKAKLYGYMFHSFKTYMNNPEYLDDFINIKSTGKVQKIGFSLYHPHEAEFILKNNIHCDILQIPFNIFDQRFSYLFSELHDRDIEIFIRSVFLQGLFFIPIEKLPPHFNSIKPHLIKIIDYSVKYKLDIASICLGFVSHFNEVDHIVIGVNSLEELIENNTRYQNIDFQYFDFSILKQFSISDENIILPFNWKFN